jgi:putative PIN family toxin of toxin-antitoxin system
VIVLDASVLISAAMGRGSVPDQAVRHAFACDRVAVSEPMMAELVDVFARPRLARFVLPDLRDEVLALLDTSGVFVAPAERVTDCRDAKDNKYLELALAARVATIVSGDDDLLLLHPWRGVRILSPAIYLVSCSANID